MHLTLWQQFSSNHSAAYTVVGVFPMPDYAQAAHLKLRAMLFMIADDLGNEQNKQMMTGAEIELAEEYGIDWQEGLDWIEKMQPDGEMEYPLYPVDEAVTLFDRLVFVSAPGSSITWQTGHQFVALMQRLGGESFQNVYMGIPPDVTIVEDEGYLYNDICFTITCHALNEKMAGEIAHLLRQYVIREDKWLENEPMPWAIYHPRAEQIVPQLTPASYAEAEQEFFREKRNGKHPIWYLRRDTHIRVGGCDLSGTSLVIHDVQFSAVHRGIGLQTLCAWLRACGCTNIQYQLSQIAG